MNGPDLGDLGMIMETLNVAAWLFVAAGAFQLVIGIAATVFLAAGGGGNALLFTERSDTGAYGDAPREIVAREPGIDTYRHVVWLILAAFLLAVGLLEMAVAWFGARSGGLWAVLSLTLVAVVLAASWTVVVATYVRHGASLSLADVPPFMWVPAVLHVVAVPLAWWGRTGVAG